MQGMDESSELTEKINEAASPTSYTFKGLFSGIFFALAGYVIQFNASSVSWGQRSFWEVIRSFHMSNPILYLLDLSPLIFAIAGALVGKTHQEKMAYLNKVRDLLKEQREQLSSLRFRHAELFEKTDDCLFVTRLDGEVVDMNRAGMKLLRIDGLFNPPPTSNEELCRRLKEKGITAQSVYSQRKERDRVLAALKEKGIVSNFEVKLKRFDGTEFDALITLTLKKDLIFGRIIDLTAIKRVEVLLKKANAELEKKNRELVKALSELQVLRIQDEKHRRELARLNEDLRHANQLLAEMAITDGLTELYNYRHFMQLLKKEWERAKRNKQDFCALMIDIDHFKDFNDRWGHQAGDEALKVVAQTLKSQTREYDIIARYGGEEFSVIFPDTTLATGYAIAKRMIEAIENKTLTMDSKGQKVRLTISAGVSAFLGKEEDPRSYAQVLKDADVALYLAKNKGRNRVEIYRSDLFTETLKDPTLSKPPSHDGD